MAITTYQCPKQQPSDNGEEARKTRLEHNRRLLARSKLVVANVEAIAPGTHTAAGTMSTESPASESIGNNTDDVPETNMKKDLVVTVVTETKTTVDEAKTSNDAEEHKVEARGEQVPKEKPRTEKPRKPKPKETENGENQALSKKAEAKRKEGYNKFSLLLGIIEEAATTTATEEREEKAEEAASKIEESEDDDDDDEDDDESESEKDQDVDVEDTTWFGAKYSCEEMQLMQDLMAKIAEKAAAEERKREKRKRKKKSKAEKPNGRKEEKPNGSYPSIGVLCLALVCIMVYSFI